MELDLTCVESFIALANTLHFGRSAALLHLTPSALTKRINKLEIQLGVLLLNRSPSGVVALTLAGERFAPHAHTLLAEARSARRAAPPVMHSRNSDWGSRVSFAITPNLCCCRLLHQQFGVKRRTQFCIVTACSSRKSSRRCWLEQSM